MGLHIPSFLVGSIFAGSGFLLIHRELSHRRRLTTKWVVQEYVEESWREWRKSSAANQIEDAKKNLVAPINNISASPAELTSTWNKGIASLRDLLSQKKD